MAVTGIWNTTKWNGCVWDTATHTLSCEVGSYSYAGIPASLSRNNSLDCSTGAYSYAGLDSTLSLKRNLLCATGVYDYTGLAAILNVKHTLLCNSGSYDYTGIAAYLNVNHSLLCNVGAYAYAGNDATLTYVATATDTKNGGDDAPRSVKNLKYKPKPRKDDFGNEIVVPEAISALTVEKYTQKPTLVSANELQSHLEIDDEEAILMFI